MIDNDGYSELIGIIYKPEERQTEISEDAISEVEREDNRLGDKRVTGTLFSWPLENLKKIMNLQ